MHPILEIIKSRRSIRKFKPDAVPQELVDQVIEAGTYAASGKGLQPWIVVDVRSKEIRERLRRENATLMNLPADKDPFYGAPVWLLVLGERSNPNHVYDCSLMLGNMMLAAHALGLGSCWINRAREEFDQPQWQAWLKSLGIEGDYEGVGHLALGFPNGEPREAKPRKKCTYVG